MTVPSAVVSAELIAAALEAADAEERRLATSLIVELLLPDALPLLLRALGDSDWRVRKEATCASRAFVPAPALVSALIAAFEPGENVGLRNAAVDVLGSCGSAATEPLAHALTRLDADGRKLVVQALGATADPHALTVLARALGDADSNVRHSAVEAISRLGPLAPAEAQKLLLRSLESQDPFCQLAALEGLNGLGAVVPWDKLEPLLDDVTLRTAALAAAAIAEDTRAPAVLVRVLGSLRGSAFLLAVATLARLSEGPLLPYVAEALEAAVSDLGERLLHLAATMNLEPQIHRGHALVLAAIASAKGVVDLAAGVLEDELLGEAADRALRLLGPKVLPDLIARIAPAEGLERHSAHVRASLIDAASALALAPCSPETLSALLEALRPAAKENERRVTTSALCALSRLGEESDLDFVAQFVGASSKPIAHAAEAAVAGLTRRYPASARRFADKLAEHLNEGFGGDACTVAIIMGALASKSGASRQTFSAHDRSLLIRCASAEDPRTRRTAIEALAVVGGDDAWPELKLALTDDVRQVQVAAARALGVVGCRACFHEPGEHHGVSLAYVVDVVTRSSDVELLATMLRTIGEHLELVTDEPRSLRAAKTVLSVLGPLARDADYIIAIAAVESIGRIPLTFSGRQEALAAALHHPDDAVVKAAMLRLDTLGAAGVDILQCLDHASFDVRSLAAEIMATSKNPALRKRLAERTSTEMDSDMRGTLEVALSSIRHRGERSSGAS